MALHEIVQSWKDRLQRRLGRSDASPERTTPARLEQLGDAPLAVPVMDVFENEKELLIRADVPGGAKDDAVVSWDESRRLTFLVRNRARPQGRPWASEYVAHDWYSALELPEYADGASATSTMKDGVLTIRIPKRVSEPKRIPVRAA
jgi:HSP20 family molecular chaperone IbpA